MNFFNTKQKCHVVDCANKAYTCVTCNRPCCESHVKNKLCVDANDHDISQALTDEKEGIKVLHTISKKLPSKEVVLTKSNLIIATGIHVAIFLLNLYLTTSAKQSKCWIA